MLSLVAPGAAVGATAYIAGSIAVGVGRWVADVYRGLALIIRGSGAGEMLELERRIALADLLAIACLADEHVEEAEKDVLRALVAEDAHLETELRDAFVRWHTRREVLGDPEERGQALRAAAAALDVPQRAQLRELVAAAPAPSSTQAHPKTPYRDSHDATASLRECLLEALASSPRTSHP